MSTQQSTGQGKSGNIRSLFAQKLSRSCTSNEARNKDASPTDDPLLTRRELANRWKVSVETIKRRERAKILRPMRLDGRIVRYRMSDVTKIEQEGYE